MPSILDRYGIKEVADVTFYKIDKLTGEPTYPVLYLDTLKVSTIEQTAETADARGGKGNPKLVTWDYGKEITVTIEDALFSAKSMAIMFGNGEVTPIDGTITRTVMAKVGAAKAAPEYFFADIYDKDQGAVRKKVYLNKPSKYKKGTEEITATEYAALEDKTGYEVSAYEPATGADGVAYAESGLTITAVTSEAGVAGSFSNNTLTLPTDTEEYDRIFITYTANAKKKEIVISAETFPGTYYVAGDTYARSDIDGSDQFFQFIIPKAKMTAENTITLEAEGDPAVFNMNLTVLRPENGEMMKLVQYELTA